MPLKLCRPAHHLITIRRPVSFHSGEILHKRGQSLINTCSFFTFQSLSKENNQKEVTLSFLMIDKNSTLDILSRVYTVYNMDISKVRKYTRLL